jgi:hypothetical protein
MEVAPREVSARPPGTEGGGPCSCSPAGQEASYTEVGCSVFSGST